MSHETPAPDYSNQSLRHFIRSEGARHLDRRTKMAIKMTIRKDAIRRLFKFETLNLPR